MGAEAELIDRAVAAHISWMAGVARATGGRVWKEDGLLAVHQPLPRDELLLPFPQDFAGLGRVLDWARANGVRTIGCWGRDDDAPAPPGFEPGWRPHWMAAELGTAKLDARVTETREVPEYDDYGQALLARMPEDTRHLVARDHGSFAGMAWLHEGALFDVYVVESMRRRGIGAALTRAAGGDVVLNATGDGERLYRSLGFTSLGYGRTWWLRA